MSNRIRVIVKKPGEDPYETTIPKTYEACRDLVGGRIECVGLGPKACIVCNEEGMLRGLTPNCWIFDNLFLGTIFVVGVDPEGDFVDCPKEIELSTVRVPLIQIFDEYDRGGTDE